MSRDHDISVLNGLTTTTLDSMKGYEDATKDAESTRFASMFADFARDPRRIRTDQPPDHAGVRRLSGRRREFRIDGRECAGPA